MKNKNQLLQNSLPLIAAGLGDKLGIRVTVSGTGAYTDGKTINIPDFDITSKEEKDAVLGYISHEAAHIKFDSFAGIDKTQLIAPLRKATWNILEDLRIEKAMIESMIGTKNWMNQIWVNRQNSGTRETVKVEDSETTIFTEYLHFTCRVKYRDQTHLMPYLEAAEEAFLYVFGWPLLTKLQKALDGKIDTLKSSVEAFALAEQICKLIEEHEPDDESDDTNTDNGDGSDDESDDTNADSGDGSDDESDDTNTDSGDGSDDESDDTNADSGDGSETSKTKAEPTGEDVKKAIQALLTSSDSDFVDEMDAFAKTLNALAMSNPSPSEIAIPDVNHVGAISEDMKKNGAQIVSSVKGTSAALTAKLQGLVQDDLKSKTKTSKSGRNLNTKVLFRPSVSDGRIFKTTQKRREIDAIVEIAIDNSNSMVCHTNLLKIAKEAQVALALALSRINGVTVTASAFPTKGIDTDVLELLSEGENVNKLPQRLGLARGQGGSTPSGSAMWHCLKKVLNSNKSKKVILFITDGEPTGIGQADALKRLVPRGEDSGVVIIGIAIGSLANRNRDYFHGFFKHALLISDISELKLELFKVARDILLD